MTTKVGVVTPSMVKVPIFQNVYRHALTSGLAYDLVHDATENRGGHT